MTRILKQIQPQAADPEFSLSNIPNVTKRSNQHYIEDRADIDLQIRMYQAMIGDTCKNGECD